MQFHGREAAQIENDTIRVTVLHEGGHIAEILHKKSGVNPLWLPPWPSIEPSTYQAKLHPRYGSNEESLLLAGIMGHNLCLDLFGPPSAEESAAGISVHGESSVASYNIKADSPRLTLRADLPLTQLRVTRTLTLANDGINIEISESVENLSSLDRALAWTQHVTLGPPFLQHGVTRFELQAAKSRTFEEPFGKSDLAPGADFVWPMAPRLSDTPVDLSIFTAENSSAKFTTHLMEPSRQTASFSAYSPDTQVLFGYRWRQVDFPWLGIWEENRSRTTPPWNGDTVACGLEFGVSPYPETRRKMIARGALFGVPGYRWLAARGHAAVEYSAFIKQR